MKFGGDVGRILSQLHWQCWREDPPPLEVEPSGLIAVLPILIRSGSVGLVWPRLRGQLDQYGAVAMALEDAYQAQVAHNEVCQREIVRAVTRLREAGIEPVLIKGWTNARLYPKHVVRPAGDIDLWVPQSSFVEASRVLSKGEDYESDVGIDLHGDAHWGDSIPFDLLNGAQEVMIVGEHVHVPCYEDHLRLLGLHLLAHSASRPLWLCDIALLLESLHTDFDWGRCLGPHDYRASWIRTTIELARQVVGAEEANLVPALAGSDPLPIWLISTVMHNWEYPPTMPNAALFELIASPKSICSIFKRRWPDPIIATVRCQVPFDRASARRNQCAAFIGRIIKFSVTVLPRQVKRLMISHRIQNQ